MKSLIIFPVCLLIALYVIIGMIVPKYQQARTMIEENNILKGQVDDQVQKLAKIKGFVTELGSFPGEVDFLNEYVPSNPLEQELINTFSQVRFNTNTAIEDIEMQDKTRASSSDATPLGRLGTTVSIKGSYDELLPFMDNIFRMKRLYNLNSVSVSEPTESNSSELVDGAQAGDLTLVADFDYVFIEKIPEVSVDDFAKKVSFEEIAAVRDQTNPVNPIVSSPSERSNPFSP